MSNEEILNSDSWRARRIFEDSTLPEAARVASTETSTRFCGDDPAVLFRIQRDAARAVRTRWALARARWSVPFALVMAFFGLPQVAIAVDPQAALKNEMSEMQDREALTICLGLLNDLPGRRQGAPAVF